MKQTIACAALAALTAGANAAPPQPSARAETPAPYRSAFADYRRYEEKSLAPWRELNDELARAAAKKPAPAVSAPPAAPGSAQPHDVHRQHGGAR